MAIIGTTQFLERIQFFNGERLFASDLQALEAFNREMRWLHNQSLHQPGVGSGFAVLGNVGDRQVTIAPGYALDAHGEEIILTQSLALPIPPVADNGSGGSVFYDLTVSYPQDSDLKPTETRVGICNCPPQGVVRLREEPVFCWVRLNDNPTNRQPVDARLKTLIRTGMFIVLAQVEIFNCQLRRPVSTAQQRSARPPKSPYVASGLATKVQWTAEFNGMTTADAFGGRIGAPYQATIDTSSGGFQANPAYIARLVGSRVDAGMNQPVLLIDGMINVPAASVSPTSFILEVFRFVAQLDGSGGAPPSLPPPTWDVAWLGVEG
ncbi:MAG: hypothetical protein OJF47_000236 [Nitrospira sp.]|jgi:hypothetical protein|nr:MAG: hypothetical protein OJF47_000236 [Nitrospira sp.]